MGAAAWQGPADDAGFRLLDFPAGRLLGLVVPAALRAEVALIGRPVGVGRGVVEVGVHGLGGAAGGVAGGGASADQVGQPAAWGGAGLGRGVIAAVPGNRSDGHVQAVEEIIELCSLIEGRRSRAGAIRGARAVVDALDALNAGNPGGPTWGA